MTRIEPSDYYHARIHLSKAFRRAAETPPSSTHRRTSRGPVSQDETRRSPSRPRQVRPGTASQQANKIKLSGAELDKFEASPVLSRFRCEATGSSREGKQIILMLKVPGAGTIHTLTSLCETAVPASAPAPCPSWRPSRPPGDEEPRSSGEWHDALNVTADGYASEVSPPHKNAVMSKAVAILNQ